MNWDFLFREAAASFYTMFAMDITSLLMIGIYFLNDLKKRPTIYLAIIAIASFIQVLLEQYNELNYGNSNYIPRISQKTMYIYLIIELACCMLYIKSYIKSAVVQKLITISIISYSAYTIIYWSLHLSEKFLPFHIEITEELIIIFFCLFYFYELFTQQPDKNLVREPPFWAISGMLFLFCAITPLFLIYDYLRKNHSPLTSSLYAINNIAYSLLFITFSIAIVLDHKKTKTLSSIA